MTDYGSPPPSWYEPPEPEGHYVVCRICDIDVWYEDATPDDPHDWDGTWVCDRCRDRDA